MQAARLRAKPSSTSHPQGKLAKSAVDRSTRPTQGLQPTLRPSRCHATRASVRGRLRACTLRARREPAYIQARGTQARRRGSTLAVRDPSIDRRLPVLRPRSTRGRESRQSVDNPQRQAVALPPGRRSRAGRWSVTNRAPSSPGTRSCSTGDHPHQTNPSQPGKTGPAPAPRTPVSGRFSTRLLRS